MKDFDEKRRKLGYRAKDNSATPKREADTCRFHHRQ